MQTIHTKIWAKRIFSLILVVFTMMLFSGCFDLGNFNDIEEYYNTFGDVRLISQTGADNAKDYSFKDYFYNEQSVNDFSGRIVDQDEYIYLILPVTNSFNLSEFSIFLKPETSGVVYFSLYISDFIPGNIRKYSDPKSQEKKDDDGNVIIDADGNPVMEDIEYGDLPASDSIYNGSVSLYAGSWDSFTAKLTTKHSTDINKYHISSGEYIIVRFENNSGLGKDQEYNQISFSLTNILIRAL